MAKLYFKDLSLEGQVAAASITAKRNTFLEECTKLENTINKAIEEALNPLIQSARDFAQDLDQEEVFEDISCDICSVEANIENAACILSNILETMEDTGYGISQAANSAIKGIFQKEGLC